MQTQQRIVINGITLDLLPQRAAFLPDYQTLLVADTHFGKDATFRWAQIPVPTGSTAGTLATLDALIEQTAAKRLIILGDMFHARSSLSQDVCKAVESFLQRHRTLSVMLTIGNHDVATGDLPEHWPIERIKAGRIGDLYLTHHPDRLLDPAIQADAALIVCGHIHPALHLETVSDRIGKLPCFWLTDKQLVLPAIGQFTGTYAVRPGASDRIWVVADDQVIELPQAYRSAASTRR